MNRDQFEHLVEEALRSLPEEYSGKLENMDIVIEEEPTQFQRKKLKLPPYITLFGLYEGVPKTRRSSGYTFVLPDKISIFQGPILRAFADPEEIKKQVRKTVLHEIGHYFGLDHEELNKTSVR